MVVVSVGWVTVISVGWVLTFVDSWVDIPSAVPTLPEFPTSHGPVVGVFANVLSRGITMGGPAIVVTLGGPGTVVVVVVVQVITPITGLEQTGPVVVVWANAVPMLSNISATIAPKTEMILFILSPLLPCFPPNKANSVTYISKQTTCQSFLK
jgi:hypothetical protein